MSRCPTSRLLGWDADWEAAFTPFGREGLVPGRIAAPHRGGSYDVLTARAEVRARLPGRSRRAAASSADVPVVGDWIALEQTPPTIHAVLPRRTRLSRRASHAEGAGATREQVVAANVDLVFVTVSLGDDPDPRLLERYLTLVLESGARPVFLFTKADLHANPDRVAEELGAVGGGVPVVAVSTRAGLGLDRVRALLEPGLTGALLGPSGAGKSTLVNALVGEELLATGSLRDDGTGRHTTTHRQLVVLPEGGILVDNPGIRELHLWLADDGLQDAFADIAELAAHCRFADCGHETEPGCAVQAALADGSLAPERWESYRELERELAELEARLVRRERSRTRRRRPGAGAS